MTRTALVLILGLILFSFSASAQDPGTMDTISLIATVTPDAQASQLKLKLELWVYNDEEILSASMGFSWDNPNLQMDSAVGTPLTIGGFGIGPFYYENADLNLTNANQRFVFAGVATATNFPAGPGGRRLWASYYFTLSSWVEADVINIDTLTFNDASTYLFVSGLGEQFGPFWTGALNIVDPNAPVDLILSDDSLHFSMVQGSPAPPFQEFTITASQLTDFTLSENAPWLLVSPISGNTPRTIRLDINPIGVTAGDYIDTVYVNSTSASNTPLHVVVTLHVDPPPPTIFFSPASFFFNAIANDTNPDPKILTIKNIGGSVLNWTLTKTQPWLDLNPSSGSDSDGVEVSVDITGLSLGTYTDTITISAPGATNTPRKVPVTLSIASDLPIIDVDLFNFVVFPTGPGIVDTTSLVIRNGGAGSMNFWVEEDATRIFDIYPDSGTAPGTVNLIIRVQAEGDYFDTVWVYSNEAINSPVEVIFQWHFVDNPAVLSLTPPSLSYNLFECSQGVSGLPPVLNFTAVNFGGDNPLSVSVSYESDLFTVLPIGGTAPQLFSVLTKDTALPVGVYMDTILVIAPLAINNPYVLEVTLNVVPGSSTPQIFLMDSVFTLIAQEDHGPIIPQYFRIQNRFGGCMEWHIDEDVAWANIFDTVGNVPDTVGIFGDATGLTLGQYTDSFYITSPTASNSPRKVKLIFKVWRFHGDNNYDGKLNIVDLANYVNYFFRGSGILPQPERRVGDLNCDDKYDLVDMNYLVNYFFRNGPPPCGNPVKK